MSSKFLLKAVIVASSLFSTFSNASNPDDGFAFWYGQHSSPSKHGIKLEKPESRIVDIDGLSDREVTELTGYNLSMLYKHTEPKSEERFLARQNLKTLATRYDSPISSYVYAIMLELDKKNFCKTNFDCNRDLSEDMIKHFTIAAKADPTGQAAFEFSSAWGRTYMRKNKEKTIEWGNYGQLRRTEYDNDQKSSSWW